MASDRISAKQARATNLRRGGAKRRCSCCVLGRRCLPANLSESETLYFENAIIKARSLTMDEHLFRIGDPFQSLYAVYSGCLKTYAVDHEGREHVLAFHFPGEIIGVDAIYPERHVSSATALIDSSVCRLPYSTVTQLAHEIPELQAQLLRLLSREVFSITAIAGDYTAEERMAAFLVMVSARLQTHGQSPTFLQLAMSRQDIANYLRLATETVSRVLARFHKSKLLQADRKQITLLDLEGLKDIAQCMNPYAR